MLVDATFRNNRVGQFLKRLNGVGRTKTTKPPSRCLLNVEMVHLQQSSAKLLGGSREVPAHYRRISLQKFLNLLVGLSDNPLGSDDVVKFDRRQKLDAIGILVIGSGIQHSQEAVHILMGQTTKFVREDHTVRRDDARKPPTTVQQARSCCWNA